MINFIEDYFLEMFFVPDNVIDDDPAVHGVSFEAVKFPSQERNLLDGCFFKAAGPAKGTVIHCHGNAGNITSHFSLILFLVRGGYNVLTFDYAGYGQSPGRPSPKGIVEDTLAALAYARGRPDVNPDRFVLFGQSLGGTAAAAAMARDPAIRCLILEATFTTYRAMAKETSLGRFLFFLVSIVIPDTGPLYDLPAIAPRPVLILHGDRDHRVPLKFAELLFRAASEKKVLAILKGIGHLEGAEAGPVYDQTILKFLEANLP